MATDRLGREIGAALLLKAAALAALYFAFFDSSHRAQVTPASVAEKLLSPGEAIPH